MMGNEDMKEEIVEMLNPTNELEGTDEVVDEITTDDDVVDDVAGEDIPANAVGSEDTTVVVETPSVTEAAQDGVKPAAGAADVDVVESIDELRARIAEMSMPAQPIAAPEEDVITDPLELFKDDVAYITEENLHEIADNPILLNAAMNNVRRQTAENLLAIVPQLINNALKAQTVKTELHNTFYGANPELAPYKVYVSSVAKDVQAKNPDKTQDEILDIVARSVKASLKIAPQKVASKAKKQGDKPALRNKSGGARTSKVSVDDNSMAAQIAELL